MSGINIYKGLFHAKAVRRPPCRQQFSIQCLAGLLYYYGIEAFTLN